MRYSTHILTSLIVLSTAAVSQAQNYGGFYSPARPSYGFTQPYVTSRPCYSGNCSTTTRYYPGTTPYSAYPTTTYGTTPSYYSPLSPYGSSSSIYFDPSGTTTGCYGGNCRTNCVNGNCGIGSTFSSGSYLGSPLNCPNCGLQHGVSTIPSTIPTYPLAPNSFIPRSGANDLQINVTSSPTTAPRGSFPYTGSQPVTNNPYYN